MITKDFIQKATVGGRDWSRVTRTNKVSLGQAPNNVLHTFFRFVAHIKSRSFSIIATAPFRGRASKVFNVFVRAATGTDLVRSRVSRFDRVKLSQALDVFIQIFKRLSQLI